jgi:hypothetical protein
MDSIFIADWPGSMTDAREKMIQLRVDRKEVSFSFKNSLLI